MVRSIPRERWTRALAAALFAVVGLVLIAVTLQREPLAARSPASRTKIAMAVAIVRADQPGELERQARVLARADPLQAAAFVMTGIDRLRREPQAFEAVRPLMVEAARRQQTFEAAQVWLAADNARRGNYNRSLALFDQVLSQSSDQLDALLPVLTTLMGRAQGRAAIIARLEGYPTWRRALLTRAIETGTLPRPVIEQLLARPAPPAYRATLDLERQAYVKWMVAQKELPAAHALFRGYTGTGAANPLYDGSFRQARPFSPFGWTLANQPEDYAERVAAPEGGWLMRLHASGKMPVTLLEQTTALAPGGWVISISARDGGLASPEGQAVELRCDGAATPLASISLTATRTAATQLDLKAQVPAGCPLQRLAFVSAATESGASEVEIISLKAARQ
jgi:hypothetical protein